MMKRLIGIIFQITGILIAISGVAVVIANYFYRDAHYLLRTQTDENYATVRHVEWLIIVIAGLVVGYILFRIGSYVKSKNSVRG